jgi:hypothetical protein
MELVCEIVVLVTGTAGTVSVADAVLKVELPTTISGSRLSNYR